MLDEEIERIIPPSKHPMEFIYTKEEIEEMRQGFLSFCGVNEELLGPIDKSKTKDKK